MNNQILTSNPANSMSPTQLAQSVKEFEVQSGKKVTRIELVETICFIPCTGDELPEKLKRFDIACDKANIHQIPEAIKRNMDGFSVTLRKINMTLE